MTGTQSELQLVTPPERGPSAEALQALRMALADGGWHTARSMVSLGLDERELRVIAECHGEEFVTGNRGYRLMSAATVDEIRQSAGRLRAQATKMLARAIALENAAHRRLHRGPEVGDRRSEVGAGEISNPTQLTEP